MGSTLEDLLEEVQCLQFLVFVFLKLLNMLADFLVYYI